MPAQHCSSISRGALASVGAVGERGVVGWREHALAPEAVDEDGDGDAGAPRHEAGHLEPALRASLS